MTTQMRNLKKGGSEDHNETIGPVLVHACARRCKKEGVRMYAFLRLKLRGVHMFERLVTASSKCSSHTDNARESDPIG